MAEKDLFTQGCFTYVTVGDIRRHILGNDFEDHHLGRLLVDAIMAKLIWSREACDFLHLFMPLEHEDIFARQNEKKNQRLGKTKECNNSQYHYGDSVRDDDVFKSESPKSPTKPLTTKIDNNYLDTISDISDEEDRYTDADDTTAESELPGSAKQKVKVEDIPTCLGLWPGEIMIPTGYKDSGEETDIYCVDSKSDCQPNTSIL